MSTTCAASFVLKGSHDVLDDVGAGQRPPQFGRQAEPCDGEHLVEPFQDRGGNALPVFFETPGEIAKELFGLAGVVHFPGLTQHASHLGVHRFRQAVHDVARLVNLAALNGRVAPEGCPDRLGKGLRAVDDEETRNGWIEAALDEIVDQGLHGRCIFRRALDQPERMLVAVHIDAQRRHKGHVLVHVNAVDLDHQQIEAGKIGRHPFLEPRRRQRDKMPGGCGFRQAGPLGRRHAALRQAHRTLELARRDVDPHLVQRPFAEPVFALRGLPTGKSLLLAVEAAKPGTRHLHLAAVEADLALRLAPAMRFAPAAPFMALAAGRQRVLLHHLGERLDPRRKAEPLEARRHARQRLGFNRIRGNRGRCGMFMHGVASFRGIDTPSLTA